MLARECRSTRTSVFWGRETNRPRLIWTHSAKPSKSARKLVVYCMAEATCSRWRPVSWLLPPRRFRQPSIPSSFASNSCWRELDVSSTGSCILPCSRVSIGGTTLLALEFQPIMSRAKGWFFRAIEGRSHRSWSARRSSKLWSMCGEYGSVQKKVRGSDAPLRRTSGGQIQATSCEFHLFPVMRQIFAPCVLSIHGFSL